jgi:hypothetical protein
MDFERPARKTFVRTTQPRVYMALEKRHDLNKMSWASYFGASDFFINLLR